MRRGGLLIFLVTGWALLVMFWNVENLFDPFDDPGKEDGQFTATGEKHWTWRKMQVKINGIAKTIISVADTYGQLPDIVGLAEVENKLVLRQLTNKTPLSETSTTIGTESYESDSGLYRYVHRESPDIRGIDVALLYRKDRIKILKVDSLRVKEFLTRDILYVKALGPGQFSSGPTAPQRDTLYIFVNHWPSQLGGKKATQDRRNAAQNLLEKSLDSIAALGSGAKIIIMGDFNREEPRMAAKHIAAPEKTKPPEIGKKPPAERRSPNHKAPAGEVSGTLKFHGKWETIDHFFVDTATARNAETGIFSPQYLLEPDRTYLGVKPRRTYIGPRYNGGLSDHLPIILSIEAATGCDGTAATGTER